MKKPTTKPRAKSSDDIRAHYDFDYTKGKRNPYASRMPEGTIAVVLDPDVASVFRTSEAVNGILRSVIAALPSGPASSKRPA